jgi:hypothetical protein
VREEKSRSHNSHKLPDTLPKAEAAMSRRKQETASTLRKASTALGPLEAKEAAEAEGEAAGEVEREAEVSTELSSVSLLDDGLEGLEPDISFALEVDQEYLLEEQLDKKEEKEGKGEEERKEEEGEFERASRTNYLGKSEVDRSFALAEFSVGIPFHDTLEEFEWIRPRQEGTDGTDGTDGADGTEGTEGTEVEE